jgi:hypothetical protein
VQKREDRKLRNRASAQMSRQRKKEEIDRIRAELDEAHKRFEHLETENRQLHARIRQLEAEVSVVCCCGPGIVPMIQNGNIKRMKIQITET